MTNAQESSTVEASETPRQEPDGNGLDTLAGLLSANSAPEGDAPADDTADAGGGPDGQEKTSLTKFNDLAQAQGMDLDTLYALEISTNDGETVTVQDLKNAYGKSDELTLRELEFEEQRTKTEGDLRRAQSELAEIIAGLPEGSVTPDVLERMRAKHSDMVQREQAKTLDAIPAWRDEDTRTAELAGMADHLASYGFPTSYLAQVIDHRQMTFIRESWLREQRIKAALAKVRPGAPNPTPPSTPSGSAPRRTPSTTSNKRARNKLDALFSNLE